jgi:hypothetical protein
MLGGVFRVVAVYFAEGDAVDTFESYMVRFDQPHFAFALCFDLLLCTPGMVGSVFILPTCRNW